MPNIIQKVDLSINLKILNTLFVETLEKFYEINFLERNHHSPNLPKFLSRKFLQIKYLFQNA